MCLANPASSAAAGEALPANVSGHSKTSVRRVTAAAPINARKITPVHTRRLIDFGTCINPLVVRVLH